MLDDLAYNLDRVVRVPGLQETPDLECEDFDISRYRQGTSVMALVAVAPIAMQAYFLENFKPSVEAVNFTTYDLQSASSLPTGRRFDFSIQGNVLMVKTYFFEGGTLRKAVKMITIDDTKIQDSPWEFAHTDTELEDSDIGCNEGDFSNLQDCDLDFLLGKILARIR